MGTSCLADVNVMGRSRVPRPPERINPFISRPIIAVLAIRAGPAGRSPRSDRNWWYYQQREIAGTSGEERDMKTLKEMLADARQVVPEQGPAEVKKRIDAGEPLGLIDVRAVAGHRAGFIESAA